MIGGELTKRIQASIGKSEVLKNNFCCENIKYIFGDAECDVLSISKSKYVTEFEVKISRSDFLSDKKKKKFQFYKKSIEKLSPNYFYYCCPHGLIKENEIDDFAGLIYIDDNGKLLVIKKAKILHKDKSAYQKIIEKIIRVYSERKFLGCCKLSYLNKEVKRKYDLRN